MSSERVDQRPICHECGRFFPTDHEEALAPEVERLREALEFYAGVRDGFVLTDGGEMARFALHPDEDT